MQHVADLLEKAGYKLDLIELPSVGPAQHLPDFSADVAEIRSRVEKAVDNGEEVVIVMHSYGGIPTAQAVKGLDVTSRQEAKQSGGVKHLFFLASFLIPEGQSLVGAFGGNPLPWFQISEDNMEVNPATPDAIFYNDLDAATQEKMIQGLKPQSYQVMHSPVAYAGWKHVPSTYLYCLKDAAIPYEVQKMMVEQFAQGVDIKTETLDASHSPFLSQPEETAAAIRRAAGESDYTA